MTVTGDPATGLHEVPGLADELRAAVADVSTDTGAHPDADAAFAAVARLHDEHVGTGAGAATLRVGGETVRLDVADELTIGRTGDRRLDQRAVSRCHLVVTNSHLGLCCYDLYSANGSWRVRDGERRRFDAAGIELTAGDRVVTVGDVEVLEVLQVLHAAEAI